MKKFKKLFSFALALVVAASVLPTNLAKAADTAPIGINVSWEDGEIDWAQAAAEVDFAVIRATEGTMADDEFANNADGCTANAVPFGVSVYTLAQTADEAVEEAEVAIAMLDGYTLDLPIYMEFEDADMYALTDAEKLAVVQAFVETVTEAGYEAGLYATMDTYNAYFASNSYYSTLNIWVSDLDATSLPLASANMWQYTWEGTVAGVDFDASLNYYYGELPESEHVCTPVTDAGKAPTCTESGLTEGSHCGECGEVIVPQEVIEATGHAEETVAGKAPTCTEAGLTDGVKCSTCGETLTAQEAIEATGHTPGAAVTENVVAKTSIDRVVYCSTCGEEISRVTIPLLRVSSIGVALENDISIAFKTKVTSVDGTYTGVYAVVEHIREDGEVRETVIEGVLNGTNYEFLYTGVAAKEVGDDLRITVYAYYGEDLIQGETLNYGMMTYCLNQLGKTASQLKMSEARTAALKTLLVDLVVYAAEAQKNFTYKVDNLATERLTEEQLALASPFIENLVSVQNGKHEEITDASMKWSGVTVMLTAKATVRVKATVNTGSIEDYTMYALIDESQLVEVTNYELVSGTTNQYYFYFDALTAFQFSDTIDFYFAKDDAKVSNTFRYSIESYAQRNPSDVMNAMIRYGRAAATFSETK